VAAIYLVHGTFVGADATGVLSALASVFPAASDALRVVIKRLIDSIVGDRGDYTPRYAALFEDSMTRGDAEKIPVRLFQWSSENHHIGRADGAVRLIDELASLELVHGRRVLLWGHSHAGNVFALATNLLASDESARAAFFDAARVYYRWPLLGWVDIPQWERVRAYLDRGGEPLRDTPLDIVTFGTPIRYGWDTGGYAQLLHFVHHRPARGLPAYRALFPPPLDDLLHATGGDYVQQLGVAGTNLRPSIFAWRCRWAEQRLNDLLQAGLRAGTLAERFAAGLRVADEGTTLLVDYGQLGGSVADHHFGHAVYTSQDWLLFHAEEVARRFYGPYFQS